MRGCPWKRVLTQAEPPPLPLPPLSPASNGSPLPPLGRELRRSPVDSEILIQVGMAARSAAERAVMPAPESSSRHSTITTEYAE